MRFEPEDFIVEELPLYEPTGLGIHTYLQLANAISALLRQLRRSQTHYSLIKET